MVKPQLDWPLLDRLTAARPDWSFVFVGPVQREATTLAAVAELGRRANVHFLGFKPPEALAAYPQHFDVCVMPYRFNHYTNQIYPLKLHEYLASGQPTVGTPIATLTAFAEVVTLARGPRAWLEGIERALAPAATAGEKGDTAERGPGARLGPARAHDRADHGERLGPAWVARLDQALERHEVLTDEGDSRPMPAARGRPDR